MRILFVHRHFPGPFRSLAQAFGAMDNTTVLFLSERGSKDLRIAKVRRLRLATPLACDSKDEAECQSSMSIRHGVRTANVLLKLKKDGFVPDVIYSASTDGYSMYLRDIFPESLFVVRADWFYNRDENHTFFTHNKPRPASDFAISRIRNMFQYNALGDCDLAIANSNWQRLQSPPMLQEKIEIVHEGVDTEFFSPVFGSRFKQEGMNLSNVQELVTFSARRAGPSQGFPIFTRSLPKILSSRPDCHVLIMCSGIEDDGGRALNSKDAAAVTLAQYIEPQYHNRVHILDYKSVVDYRHLLRSSSVHVYLTAPYTLSAGLIEALSCGCLVVGSDTPPVKEVITHGENGFLTNFWDSDALAETVLGVLERNSRFMSIREAARKTVMDNYNLDKQTEAQKQILLCAFEKKKNSAY